MRRIITVLLLGGVLVAACGGEATDDTAAVPVVPDSVISDGLPLADDDNATVLSGVGPGISVEEALASTLDGPLLVNGYVFVYPDGSVVFADLILESFPPQPGGATVTVEGLDVMQLPLTEGPTDRWPCCSLEDLTGTGAGTIRARSEPEAVRYLKELIE